MQDWRSLDDYIAACLRGTRLPVDRRQEAAEQLRSHIEDLATAKGGAGMNEEDAVRAALAQMGSPRDIRRGFRRRQLRLDIRAGWMETRKQWLLPVWAGLLACMAFGTHVASDGIASATLRAGITFIALIAFLAGFQFVFATLAQSLKHPLPRSEYQVLPSLLRWHLSVAAGLGFVFLMGMVTAAMISRFGSPAEFCRNYVIGWRESGTGILLRCVLGTVGFGLALSLYERRQCVSESDCVEKT